MTTIDSTREIQSEMAEWRRDIHAHPETAFEEVRTADFVARKLESFGLEVHQGLAKTGVVGTLRSGSGNRSIALRADMDALPMAEANTFSHRSRHPGKMHACGHDGHTTMLLGAAKVLAQSRTFDGAAIFIFQPAEEQIGGGRVMIEEGLFDKFPVDSVFGMHNWPGLEVGRFGLRSGPMAACADNFEITVQGRGAHAAMPHHGVDPIVAGAALVQSLQTIVSRNLHPIDSGVLSVTQFHAGDAFNVIPDAAVLRGTARAFTPGVRDALEAGIRRVSAGVAAAYGANIDANYMRGYPPLVNWPRETDIAATVLEALVGAENVIRDAQPTMGGEDFAYMLEKKPGCFVFIGNGPGEGGCMLHNPHYDFNDEILPLGSAYWVRLVEHVLAKTWSG